MPSSCAATCSATVCTPWPISVQPWRTSTPSVVRPEPHDRPAHLAEAVAEARVLEPEAEPDRLAVGDRRLVVGADLVEAHLGAAGAVVHDLARPPRVAGADHVALADLPRPRCRPARRAGRARPPSRTAPGWRRSRGTLRTRGCSCARRSSRRRSPASGTGRRRGRRRARAPSCRRWRRRPSRRCRARAGPVSRPSASQPARYSIVIGWRLGWISRLSSRDSVHFTGRSSSHAASAVWAWLAMSSLPPKAPPLETSSTVIRSRSTPSTVAMSLRSSHTPCPPE